MAVDGNYCVCVAVEVNNCVATVTSYVYGPYTTNYINRLYDRWRPLLRCSVTAYVYMADTTMHKSFVVIDNLIYHSKHLE